MVDDRQRASAEEILIDQARLVVYRLERVSADSIWAHRSSGLRGGLLRWIDRIETGLAEKEVSEGQRQADLTELKTLIFLGFEMLESAAREKIRA